MPMLLRLGEFIWRQRIFLCQRSRKHSSAGQLSWIELCSETSEILIDSSGSFLSSGNRSILTKLSGILHWANVAVARVEENRERDAGGDCLYISYDCLIKSEWL